MNAPPTVTMADDFASVRAAVLSAIDNASDTLNRYALKTDAPELGIVECADLLDAARDALAGGS